jgi:predicted DNA-binding ribbon-helix-helix protein
MSLPEELEKQFQIELKAFEEARQMKYVTTMERMAEERQKQVIACNMLRKNMDLETIAEVTGLSIEQIQALQAQGNQEA